MMQKEEKEIAEFLETVNENNDWSELILFVEIQPGMISFKGQSLDTNGKIKSLRTKPTEEIKQTIRDLHYKTSTDINSKWNRLQFRLKNDQSFIRSFSWDQGWQNKIDQYNIEHKAKNPDYNLPKWSWENQES